MQIANLKNLPPVLANRSTEVKEAIVDALLNMTWQECSGSGEAGAFVFGVKPSQRFVSGFLLPRLDEKGDRDETSEIHMSAHGLDFQIAQDASGLLVVKPDFSIYVRVLPSWADLSAPGLDLMPHPPLRADLQIVVSDSTKTRLRQAFPQWPKSKEERTAYRNLQQSIYKEELARLGVKMSAGTTIVEGTAGVPHGETNQPEELVGDVDEAVEIKTQSGVLEFEKDDPAQPVEIPQKWIRLKVNAPPFVFDTVSSGGLLEACSSYSAGLVGQIKEAVNSWVASPEGGQWGYRPATVKPSDLKSASAWDAFLDRLRLRQCGTSDCEPQLDAVALSVTRTRDLRDPNRDNIRILLENNCKDVRKRQRDRFENVLHQVSLKVGFPSLIHRKLRLDRIEPSYRYRQFLTYAAIGVNCGVSEQRVGEETVLSTTWMPRYTQPRVVPKTIDGLPIEFAKLADPGLDPASLRPFVRAYKEWISIETQNVDPEEGAEDDETRERETCQFSEDLRQYDKEAELVSRGISLLEYSRAAYLKEPSSPKAVPYRAWLLLNETFLEANRARDIQSWRLFQLGFILAHIPTLASRMPVFANDTWANDNFDEQTATLLYFPTGGGKSEAFFGLLVFNLFLDRLRGKLIGVTALVRYPLRLLTLQQAQRLHGLMVWAELVRLKRSVPGHPFELGFWVGSANTPNQGGDKRLSAIPIVQHPSDTTKGDETQDYREANKGFNKIPSCPLCKGETALRRLQFPTAIETVIVCQNQTCTWNVETHGRPLPFLIVDHDIYRHAPAVLLGVIDKLALIGQHPSTINRIVSMFGLARWREINSGALVFPSNAMMKDGPAAHQCITVAPSYTDGEEIFVDPFPSLVIQDEAHLLEESLGTFAGLFETILEQLFRRLARLLEERVARSEGRTGRVRLPKYVAATATVSVPRHQFGALYQREHLQFPYPGTSIYRSFYAEPYPPSAERSGLAKNAPNSPEIESPWMRVYCSLMTNGRNHTVTTVTALSAYHVLVTEFWEDLQDPATRAAATQRLVGALSSEDPLHDLHKEALLLYCDKAPEVLLTILDLMRISLTYVTNKKGGDQVIDAFGEEVAKRHHRHSRDFVRLRTELISGGVDVAEIQRVMREAEVGSEVGSELPVLHQCLRSIVATSAISHGVDVDKFNAMFFAGMPNDIAEFIQASSRVGRAHVGFSLLIPTPHSRRDRYIVETHDIFHRFLERMIAPPAITRWAASALDRVLTSLFQAWLCGWVEQLQFVNADLEHKKRFPKFGQVNDVRRLLESREYPDAVKDFTDFAVDALGVFGRGVNHVGAAPHLDFYEDRVRNKARDVIEQFRDESSTAFLHEYWGSARVGTKPMMSLRDIDTAGYFELARRFGGQRRMTFDEQDRILDKALKIVRRQYGRVAELDPSGAEED